MILLYNSLETDFTHNGLGVLNDCIVAEVEEVLNGVYSLYIEYPIFAKKSQLITHESIIKAPTPKGYQLFRVNRPVKTMGVLKLYANHIFFDLKDNFIEDTNIVMKNGLGALEQMLLNTQYAHYFKVFSDIDTYANARIVRKNPVEAILSDDDNSFINRWGGELERDNFNVRMLKSIGIDRGVTIRYGKNLIGIEEDLKMDDVATRIMPIGYDGLMLPEKYIDSPLLNNYTRPKITKVEFSNIKVDEETTLAQAQQQLRDGVNHLYLINKVDTPKVNYRVNFVELSKTEEYKNYAILERVYIGDTVTVKHEKIGINIKAKVISYRWDCLLNKYIGIELGNFKDNIGSSLSGLNKAINTITQSLDGLETSVLQQAKDEATALINNGLGGYVVKNRNEILIMDTDDINTATKVWRWNKNGLGFSSTGYTGTYGLAMTANGAIVADFITTGKLNASLMTAGTLDAKKITVSGLVVGDNVTMGPNATISWNKVTDQPTIPSPTPLPSYITSTKITSTTIESPSIVGGTITGSSFNVETALNLMPPKDITNPFGSSAWLKFFKDPSNYVSMYYNPTLGLTINDSLQLVGGISANGYINITDYGSTGYIDIAEGTFDRLFAGTNTSNGYVKVNSVSCYSLSVTGGTPWAPSGHTHSNFGDLGTGTIYATAVVAGGGSLNSSGHLNAYYVGSYGNIAAQGNLSVSGSKNALQETKNYGKRLINAYETAEYYFGDIGHGVINQNGECVIHLDEIFQECVNMNIPYHVFIQAYNGNIGFVDRQDGYFIVRGTPGAEFSWEAKAKRLGYENHRLEIFEDENPIEYSSVGADIYVQTNDDIIIEELTRSMEYSNIENELNNNSNLEDNLLEV